MRRFASIWLFLLLILPYAGTYTWLQVEKSKVRKSVKREIMAGLDESKLVKLEFTAEEALIMLKWHHSQEFEFNGQLFDVVRQRSSGSLITFWCFPDHAETQLEQQLASLLQKVIQRDPQRQEKRAQSQIFYKNLFCEGNNESSLHTTAVDFEYYLRPLPQLNNPYFSPPAPPPRFC